MRTNKAKNLPKEALLLISWDPSRMGAGRGDAITGKHSSRRCVKSLFEPLFVEAVTQKGAKAVLLRLDVGESAGFVAFRDEVVAALDSEWKASSFDYLVNNAGFLQMALFEDTTEELFDAYVRVLLKGPYFLTQAMLPVIADGGSIVNVTSNSAFRSGIAAGASA